ncbi:MAG TPA: hypothetical protein VNS22_18825 [Geminicoccus sp.]|uniref:hypothetical protein n=1 Tax=Geminicoccus sp. TaxID=2024832 RepID=UPI002C002C0C|nr:hypothetical protein [Geminicoccus sp.]HWL70414.1 hypothetical protein [Geminicoccus sp.]
MSKKAKPHSMSGPETRDVQDATAGADAPESQAVEQVETGQDAVHPDLAGDQPGTDFRAPEDRGELYVSEGEGG